MKGTPNMTVVRVEKDKNFTCISNALIFDKSISVTAKILMLQMLAVKPDKWNVNDEGLCTLLGKGLKAVKSALAELVQHGYLFKYQVKDEETKQFGHNRYDFYESPMLNPHFGKSAQNKPDFFATEPSERKPSDGEAELLTINPQKIKKTITESLSVTEGTKTDGFSAEKEKSSEISEDNKQSLAIFYDTERVLKKMMDFQTLPLDEFRVFAEKAIRYISETLATGEADPVEVINQIKVIHSAEKSLIPFMDKMMKYCKKSLKNLKYPKAQDSYLKKVVIGFLKRYIPVSAEKENNFTPQTALPFGEMLLEMHHPDVNKDNYQKYPFDTQEHFIQYYGEDCNYWKKENCHIPESFIVQPMTMLNALNFLFSFCYKKTWSLDFRTFARECVAYLAESICTGMRSYTQHTSPTVILSKINSLNMGFGGNNCSLYGFIKSFQSHLKEKLQTYSVKSNYKGYLTTMLLSYLFNEYSAKNREKSVEVDIFGY